MTDDTHLLRQFAAHRDEPAFAKLVGRHVDLVYSAALRQMAGDHHRAQEVTQMVFTDLSRKAAALVRHPVLPAWLHRSTHFAALRLRRSESRRKRYEEAAGREPLLPAAESPPVAWEDVRPVLDEAIDGLDERDRRAVLLRYFSSAGFGDLGRQLGLNENAARMRVERALGKLRERLERKGIKSSSAALAAALSAHAISAAPPGVAAAAAAQAAAAGTGTAVGAWLAFMSSSKFPLSLAATVILGGASVFTLQERAIRRTSDEVAASAGAAGALSALEAQNQQLRASAQEALGLQRDAASLPALRAYAKVLEERASRSGPAAAPSPEAPKAPMLDDAQSAFDITKLDQRPKALLQVRPQYPAALRAIGASGEALVDFIVGSDGRVYNAYAVSASVNGEAETADGPQFVVSAAGRGSAGSSSDSLKTDSSAFESAAVQAVSQWTFQPGQVNGQSVNTHMRVPIVFSVAPAPAPTAATWF